MKALKAGEEGVCSVEVTSSFRFRGVFLGSSLEVEGNGEVSKTIYFLLN